ncbi:MAG TPA: DUF296 domain-containing protein [Firmicutes bacterium]|nr:MAG: DNA-binding protein [Candidatus Coatesbacteria bacterium]RLC42901.1 MAG: DNA-binding protein [Candidatus Coatesbacteria bacterium]RLC43277.1 MAG: DNA-binding protein [Candidatus Coatesbacteria bacterium]HDM43529.1 DUF296 domain-containing protein [Bacillota bacterium]
MEHRIERFVKGDSQLIRLKPESDLLETLNNLVERVGIEVGVISGIGSVGPVNIGYYDFNKKEYRKNHFKGIYELVSLMGNISVKDNKPFCHCHIVIGDKDGKVYGGHLLPGTIVKVGEFHIDVLKGTPPERIFDVTTGLHLWNLKL